MKTSARVFFVSLRAALVLAPLCFFARPPAPLAAAEAESVEKRPAAADAQQRAQYYQEQLSQRERNLKRVMASFGVEDEETQNVIIAHLTDEVKARRAVRELTTRLSRALRRKSTPDAEIAQLTTQLQAALADDQQRRKQANLELDRQIGYSQKPRLEAMLMVLGLIGDASVTVSLPPPRPQPRPQRPPVDGDRERREKMMKRFDADGDGRLDASERAQRDAARAQRSSRAPRTENNPPNAVQPADEE